jgi:putative hemolysin
MPVGELKARLQLDYLPDEDLGRYNTLAGLMMAVCGHLPVSAERIECSGYTFEVQQLQGRRIASVRAWRNAESPPDS